jgi:hypothetical protein
MLPYICLSYESRFRFRFGNRITILSRQICAILPGAAERSAGAMRDFESRVESL